MKFTVTNNLIFDDQKQISFRDTPNKGGLIKPIYLIMHFTGAPSASSTINWFMNKAAKVSAHLLIDRDGRINQFVAFNRAAWHAGQSNWQGRTNLNNHSIGIEFVNSGLLEAKKNQDGSIYYFNRLTNTRILDYQKDCNGHAWENYTPAQMDAAVKVAEALVSEYRLVDVLGHEQIAPGRKVDPGPAFKWELFAHLKPKK